MLIGVTDTHCVQSPSLTEHLADRVRAAEVVVHAGDFTTQQSLATFQQQADQLVAVYGNADKPAVRSQLPETEVTTVGETRVGIVHRHDSGAVGVRMFGRSVEADLVITGHTHRPEVHQFEELTVVNPGSHTTPRGAKPGYFEYDPTEAVGWLRTPTGALLQTVTVD